MTNEQRRNGIKEINKLLSPLNHEKFIASLRHNFLTKPYREKLTKEEEDESKKLEEQIKELNIKINPLFTELRGLQIKYGVEYDGEVLESGVPTKVRNKKIFYLSTEAEIDSYQRTPDYTDQDVGEIISELSNYIYHQEYSIFTIQHIKRI
jgi:hypothetical protein